MSKVWDSDEFMDTWWAWMILGYLGALICGYACAVGAPVLALVGLVVAIFCGFTARRLHHDDIEDVRRRAHRAARFRQGLP